MSACFGRYYTNNEELKLKRQALKTNTYLFTFGEFIRGYSISFDIYALLYADIYVSSFTDKFKERDHWFERSNQFRYYLIMNERALCAIERYNVYCS